MGYIQATGDGLRATGDGPRATGHGPRATVSTESQILAVARLHRSPHVQLLVPNGTKLRRIGVFLHLSLGRGRTQCG